MAPAAGPDYLAKLMLRSAVERQIEIIGEAARRVSNIVRSVPALADYHVLVSNTMTPCEGATSSAS